MQGKKSEEKAVVISDGMTYRERMFVKVYDGDMYQAARMVGFTDKQAEKLMSRRRIQNALARRESIVDPMTDDKDIARRKAERMAFWMESMKNADMDMRDRLRASELSGKADGDFVEKVQIDQTNDIVIRWGVDCDPGSTIAAQVTAEVIANNAG